MRKRHLFRRTNQDESAFGLHDWVRVVLPYLVHLDDANGRPHFLVGQKTVVCPKSGAIILGSRFISGGTTLQSPQFVYLGPSIRSIFVETERLGGVDEVQYVVQLYAVRELLDKAFIG